MSVKMRSMTNPAARRYAWNSLSGRVSMTRRIDVLSCRLTDRIRDSMRLAVLRSANITHDLTLGSRTICRSGAAGSCRRLERRVRPGQHIFNAPVDAPYTEFLPSIPGPRHVLLKDSPERCARCAPLRDTFENAPEQVGDLLRIEVRRFTETQRDPAGCR